MNQVFDKTPDDQEKKLSQDYRKLLPGEGFQFSCHNHIACFTQCCRDTNIFLTPYDVLRMRQELRMASGDFLKQYTVAVVGYEGLPLVVLKMRGDEAKTCPLATPEGCRIYEDRPWSCRMFPLFPDSVTPGEFLIKNDPDCLGFKEGKTWTSETWRKDQALEPYDRMNTLYETITFHDFFKEGKRMDPGRAETVHMGAYDLDLLKKFLQDTKFFDRFETGEFSREKILKDDLELLKFGLKWIRFMVFDEDLFPAKDSA